MSKLFRPRTWLIGIAIVAVATPAVATGVALAAGSSDPNDYVRSVVYVKAVTTSAKAATKSVTATCPSPKKVIGGGASTSAATSLLRTSEPNAADTAWTANATGLPIGTWTLEAVAICADVHGAGPTVASTSGSSSGSNPSASSSGDNGASSSGDNGASSSGG